MRVLVAITACLFCSGVFAASLDWFVVEGKVKSFDKSVVELVQSSGGKVKVFRPLIEGNYKKLRRGQLVKAHVHKTHFAILNLDQ